jgi:hypothetical protein
MKITFNMKKLLIVIGIVICMVALFIIYADGSSMHSW